MKYQEIERKFLVTNDSYRTLATDAKRIVQGYICTEASNTVRVRIYGEQGYLTIKGKSDSTQELSRFEWEKEISLEEAEALLQLCGNRLIEKIRYRIPNGKHVIEVDEFHGLNEGLIVAEIELNDENESYEHPAFLGEEVTGIVRYYNSQLTKKPFCKW